MTTHMCLILLIAVGAVSILGGWLTYGIGYSNGYTEGLIYGRDYRK